MLSISSKEARQQLSSLLKRVEKGEEIAITRRGKQIAHLVPHVEHVKTKYLPSLKAFRRGLDVKGPGLSEAVIAERNKERF